MSWFFLICSIWLDLGGTIALKLADGFNKIHFSLLSLLLYGVCYVFFAYAIRAIPLGTAFAVWAGGGAVLVAVSGVLFFNESLSIQKTVFMIMIVIGIVGLKLYEH